MLLLNQRNSLLLFCQSLRYSLRSEQFLFLPRQPLDGMFNHGSNSPVTTSSPGKRNRAIRTKVIASILHLQKKRVRSPREHEGENERISLVVVVIASPFHAFGGRPDIEAILLSVPLPTLRPLHLSLPHHRASIAHNIRSLPQKHQGVVLPDDESLAGISYPPSPSPNRYLPHRYQLSLLYAQSELLPHAEFYQ